MQNDHIANVLAEVEQHHRVIEQQKARIQALTENLQWERQARMRNDGSDSNERRALQKLRDARAFVRRQAQQGHLPTHVSRVLLQTLEPF